MIVQKNIGSLVFALFTIILALALIFVRISDLKNAPPNVSGDEVTFLNDVIRIRYFPQKVNFFSLMGDGSESAVNFYYMSLVTRFFTPADMVLGMRFSSVLLSLGILTVFYIYLLTKVGKIPALLATSLLGMNAVFLNFSRATWMSDGHGLGLIGGILSFILIERAVTNKKVVLAAAGGLCAGLALYGYFGNSIFPLSCLVYLGYAAFRRRLTLQAALVQIAIFTGSTILVFLPQLIYDYQNLNQYTRRARSTSVTAAAKPYYGRTDLPGIMGHQFAYTLSGFLFLDPAVAGEGVENERYVPPVGAFDTVTRIFFFLGLGTALFLVRKNLMLPTIAFTGSLALNLFSQFPPNFARGFFVLPFIYLMIAVFLDKLWSVKLPTSVGRVLLIFFIVSLGLYSARNYFLWNAGSKLAQNRQPAIQYKQVPLWINISKAHIAAGAPDLTITSDEWQNLTSVNQKP